MVAHCPPQHCRFSKGEPRQQLNPIMQTGSLAPADHGSTLSTKYYSWSHSTVTCCVHNSSDRLETHVVTPVCEANFLDGLDSLKSVANVFRLGLCFSALKPRFIFLFWGLTFIFSWAVILETAPVVDLLVHKGQDFDLLTSCSACLLFVLMCFPLLKVYLWLIIFHSDNFFPFHSW